MPIPKRQTHLRAKLDAMLFMVDLLSVFGPGKSSDKWREDMGNIGLARHALGLVVPPDKKLGADEHANIGARTAKLLHGDRPLAWEQLVNLAKFTKLDRFLGEADEAARSLSDDVSLQEFKRRLLETRWAHPDFAEQALYATRHLLLAAFAEFSMHRKDIYVGPDIVATRAPPTVSRGARLPQPEDLDEGLQSFALDTRLKVRLDLRERRGIVLLEICPAPEKRCAYGIKCLAPSPLAPERFLQVGNVMLPARPYNGLDSFILDQPLGRHDWLAVLTPKALNLPWLTPEDTLHEPSSKQLGALLSTLTTLAAESRDVVEVRHFPFRVVDRGLV